jgi:phenylacetate-CoA ligase
MDGEVARDRMTLQVEVSERPEGLAERIAGSVREVTRLRSDVLVLPPGSLPNDGKLIEDARSYR